MTPTTTTVRSRGLRIGAPAAVLGVLTGSIAVAPAAQADAVAADSSHQSVLAPGARAQPAQTTPTKYTVQPGDTVSAIAERHALHTEDVLRWNGLTWRSVIVPGQVLALSGADAAPPAVQSSAATHVVAAGDTVFSIAQRHGTTVDAVLAANGLTGDSVIYPNQVIALPGGSSSPAPQAPAATPAPDGGTAHIVVSGDTLFAIAARYGASTALLYAWNGLDSSSIIYPGQSIVVTAPAPAAVATGSAPLEAVLDGEQSANAALIIRVGRDLGIPDRGIALALATAMVESSLRNRDHGDRDSLGLFQQRPSTGWGEPAQILDAERSIRTFYGGPTDPNGTTTRGLLDISGWAELPFTDAAQAVQISAYPDRYGLWEAQAQRWLAQFG